MKILMVSILSVILVFIGGIWSHEYIEINAVKLIEELEAIEKLIEQDQWKKADDEFQKLSKKWEGVSKFWMVIINHEEIDNIEMSLQKAQQYIKGEDRTLTMAELYTLKYYFKHSYLKEQVNIHNIF